MKPRSRFDSRRTRKLTGVVGALAACLAAGCKEQSSQYRHQALCGTVESVRAKTDQLTVRIIEDRPRRGADQKIACLLTNAEVYINDAFSSFDAIEIGDTVELIGYRDPSPRAEQFIVSLACITRNEPRPPEPDLSPPTTSPATQPQES